MLFAIVKIRNIDKENNEKKSRELLVTNDKVIRHPIRRGEIKSFGV